MDIFLLGTALTTLIIFITIIYFIIKEIKTNSLNRKETPLIILALIYLVFTIILTLWTFNFFVFNISDFQIVFSAILLAQTICLLSIIVEIYQNKKVFYTLIPFALLIPLIIIAPQFIHLMIPLSFLVTLSIFLATTTVHENPTRYLIFYTSISLFLYLFSTLWQNITQIFGLVSNILFLLFLISFLKFLQHYVGQNLILTKFPESPLIYFLKHFIFIIIITNFIFIGTISLHEFGHLATSSKSNCGETKIVYELRSLPHTEIKCKDTSQKNFWTLGGILLPLIIATFLFFSGGKFVKEISLQIIGFNMIISYLDLISLNLSKAIATTILISGITLIVFSLALLVKSRVE